MTLSNQNNPMTRKERILRGLRYYLGVYAAMVVPVLVCWLWTAGPIERHMPYHSIDQWYRLCSPVALLAWSVACFPRRCRWHRVAAGIFVVVAIVSCGVLASRKGIRCPWNPAINTEFTEGYSEKVFSSIRPGMTEAEVLALLGEPFKKNDVPAALEGSEEFVSCVVWRYSRAKKDKWGGFECLGRNILFHDGIVKLLWPGKI